MRFRSPGGVTSYHLLVIFDNEGSGRGSNCRSGVRRWHLATGPLAGRRRCVQVTPGRGSVLGPWAGAVARPPSDALDVARSEGGLTRGDLPSRYLVLGGMSGPLELEAFCSRALQPSAHDHGAIAHALNERFSELGRNHPVEYDPDREDDGS
jgi:hypothetical protein